MDRATISAIAHGDHPIASPLDDDSVARLLERALPRGNESLLDLGCGSGTWLVRALSTRPGVTAVGVDIDAVAIDRAQQSALRQGFANRVGLHVMKAADFRTPEPFDVVLSVGATHAFGGLLQTLHAVRPLLRPGGQVLVGDGFWESEPTDQVIRAGFDPDEFDSLSMTAQRVADAGWLPCYAHVSTAAEWDDYEWSWIGTLTQWALDHPDHPDSRAAREAAEEHRRAWLDGYRGILGFVTLLLRDIAHA